MKVWITKHALTQGIIEAEAEALSEGMIFVKSLGYCGAYFHGSEWHVVQSFAIERAEKMRRDKIASHLRSIRKLEQLTFEVKP